MFGAAPPAAAFAALLALISARILSFVPGEGALEGAGEPSTSGSSMGCGEIVMCVSSPNNSWTRAWRGAGVAG